jgi:predicted acylesterase/phospholipase RssA/CRP-like cAMP-binding protein
MRELSSMSIGRGISPFAALQRSALFEGLSHADLTGASLLMEPRRFETGEELCHEGDVGDSLLVVIDGLVHVLAPDSRTLDSPVLAKLRRGDVVGAMSVISGDPHTATVVAGMPTETLVLSKQSFDELTERHPVMLANLVRVLGRRLARSNVRQAQQQRGDAVALIVGATLLESVEPVIAATEAASARPVAWLDTRTGFDAAVTDVDELLADHGTVLLVARAQGKSAPLLLDHVDRAVILVEDEREAARFAGARGAGDRVQLVLVGGSSQRLARGRLAAGLPVVGMLERTLPPGDLAWLGRHLAGTKLGLALGAGGAKGFAEVGALYVLEDAGYSVDYVAGSSIGAIIGSYLALGMGAAEIDAKLREAFDPATVAEIFKISLSGASTGLEAITRVLRQTTDDRGFEDVVIPLAIMAVDLTDREPAPIREGKLWEALLAATALAGVFPPYEKNGHRFVDGLALVPVPTDAVLEDGADVAISVNLMPRELLPAWPGETAPTVEPKRGRGSRMLETLLEVMDLMQLDTSARNAETADVVITPRFGPGSWRDFHLADHFLAAGRQAAEEQLPALRSLARAQGVQSPS